MRQFQASQNQPPGSCAKAESKIFILSLRKRYNDRFDFINVLKIEEAWNPDLVLLNYSKYIDNMQLEI